MLIKKKNIYIYIYETRLISVIGRIIADDIKYIGAIKYIYTQSLLIASDNDEKKM